MTEAVQKIQDLSTHNAISLEGVKWGETPKIFKNYPSFEEVNSKIKLLRQNIDKDEEARVEEIFKQVREGDSEPYWTNTVWDGCKSFVNKQDLNDIGKELLFYLVIMYYTPRF